MMTHVRTRIRSILLFALFAAPLVLFSYRAYAGARLHEPAWIVRCPGVGASVVYKSGWFITYSGCATELPVSIPSGCIWMQVAADRCPVLLPVSSVTSSGAPRQGRIGDASGQPPISDEALAEALAQWREEARKEVRR